MTTLEIQAITEAGATVYASIQVSNDYTMNEVVNMIRARGFRSFRLVKTMKRFVTI